MRNLMTCPECRETMISEPFGSAWIEVCQSGCRGLWFDQGELQKLDANRKGAGAGLEAALREQPSERPAGLELDCPLCSTALGRFRHELAPEVEFDECPGCNGLFLRAGELGRLRHRPETGEEIRARIARERRARERAARRQLEKHANHPGMLLMLALLDD